jgi:hypothetical protein
MATNNKINNVLTLGNNAAVCQPLVSVVTLQPSDITSLQSTPFNLIAAPGNNLFVFPYLIVTYVNYVSAYSNGSSLKLQNGVVFFISGTAIANGLTVSNSTINATTSLLGPVTAYSQLNNQRLDLIAQGADFTGGTSTMTVYTYYYLMTAV